MQHRREQFLGDEPLILIFLFFSIKNIFRAIMVISTGNTARSYCYRVQMAEANFVSTT